MSSQKILLNLFRFFSFNFNHKRKSSKKFKFYKFSFFTFVIFTQLSKIIKNYSTFKPIKNFPIINRIQLFDYFFYDGYGIFCFLILMKYENKIKDFLKS